MLCLFLCVNGSSFVLLGGPSHLRREGCGVFYFLYVYTVEDNKKLSFRFVCTIVSFACVIVLTPSAYTAAHSRDRFNVRVIVFFFPKRNN